MEQTDSPWEQQQQFVARMKKERPNLLSTDRPFLDETVLPQIGITGLPPDRPEGYIKLIPQDFIVEEIQLNEQITDFKIKDGAPERIPKHRTLYANLIKVGISTLDAAARLGKNLGIPEREVELRVGFAGIKDPLAFTSQRIALTRTKFEDIPPLENESFFLTDFACGQGRILRGQLLGNRFTIFVRTAKAVNRDWLTEKLFALKEQGFLNYYHSQRFGSERLSSHILGGMILRGEYEAAVKHYLTYQSPYDNNLAKTVRAQATENYGDWREMKRIMAHLPFTFSNELNILNYFIRNSANFIGALYAIREVTRLCVYAYASLLFNRYLSQMADQGKKPLEFLPLLTSDDPADQALYANWLKEDNIADIKSAVEPLTFIALKKRLVPTRVFAVNARALPLADGVITHFCLPKGSYATTYLMNMFKLWQGYPLPTWISQQEYDTLELLGVGSIAQAKERLKKFVYMPLDKLQQIQMGE